MTKRSLSSSPRVTKLSRKNSHGGNDYTLRAAEVWETVGACAATMGIHAIAIKLYDLCLNYNPLSIKALIGWSKLLRLNDISFNETVGSQTALRRLSEATDRFTELAKSSEIYKELTECYLLLGLTDQAHQTIQHAIVLNPDVAELHLLLGQTLIRAGLRVQAAAALKRALELLPPNIADYSADNIEVARNTHAELAAIAAADGHFEVSIDELKQTLQLPPPPLARLNEYVALWCALLTALERAGRVNEALEACERAELAVGVLPRILITHAYLLLLEEDKDKAFEAVRLLNRVVDLEQQESAHSKPKDSSQLSHEPNGQGNLHPLSPDKDTADDATGDFLPWCLLGKAYTLLFAPRAAYDLYQIALRRASLLPITWLAVGKLYLELKQLPDALAAYSQALRLQLNEDLPGTAAAWDGLSCVYERCDQQLTDAADLCLRALLCFAAFGDAESAREYEERAQKLKDAADGKGPVPPLKSPLGVPNYFLRDLVTLLPSERIALIQQAKDKFKAEETPAAAGSMDNQGGATPQSISVPPSAVPGTAIPNSGSGTQSVIMGSSNGGAPYNGANNGINGSGMANGGSIAEEYRPAHNESGGSVPAPAMPGTPQYVGVPAAPHGAPQGIYGLYKPNEKLPIQMAPSFPPGRQIWPGQEHLANQPHILHGPPQIHPQFAPPPNGMYPPGQLGPPRQQMAMPQMLGEGYPVAGPHGYVYGQYMPVPGGMLAQVQPYNWRR